MTPVIDPYPPITLNLFGAIETTLHRCRHDMVADWCSWRKGLPDVRQVDDGNGGLADDELDVSGWFGAVDEPGLRFLPLEKPAECARCGTLVKELAFSREHNGGICRACGDAA